MNLIKIFRSNSQNLVYVGKISSSSPEDYSFQRNGDFFSLRRDFSDKQDILNTKYDRFEGKDPNGNAITFNSATAFESYLNIILAPRVNYRHTIIVDSVSTDIMGFNSTTDFIIEGYFLDQVQFATTSSVNGIGALVVNSVSIDSWNRLIVNVSSDNQIDTHTLTLHGIDDSHDIQNIRVLDISTIIPNSIGVPPELWVKSIATNNNAIVGLGSFEADNSTGNNWDEHAYFGPVSSTSRIDLNFTVDRLDGVRTAYCYIRLNNTNNPTTGGVPRIYIQNGSNLYLYGSTGGGLVSTLVVGDRIKFSVTTSEVKVFKNGALIATRQGSYNLNNVFCTFTGYRVLKVSEIDLQVFN